MAQVIYTAPAGFGHHGHHPSSTITVPPGPTHTGPHQPPPVFDPVFMHTHKAGCIALWVFFGVFAAGTVGVGVLAMRVARRERVFHALAGITLAITTMSYLMLATGLGMSPSTWEFHRGHHGRHGHHGGPIHHYAIPPVTPPPEEIPIYIRQRLWSRDFAHVLTAPLLFLQLAVLSGMAPLAGLMAAGSAAAASFAGAIANAFPRMRRLRGAWVAWIVVAALWTAMAFAYILIPGGAAARRRAPKTRSRFFLASVLLFLAFANYGIMSLLGPALQVTSVDIEIIVLGITDVAAQLGFIFFLLFTHVHDDEDPSYTFPEWFAEPRGGADGRGTYASVAAGAEAT